MISVSELQSAVSGLQFAVCRPTTNRPHRSSVAHRDRSTEAQTMTNAIPFIVIP